MEWSIRGRNLSSFPFQIKTFCGRAFVVVWAATFRLFSQPQFLAYLMCTLVIPFLINWTPCHRLSVMPASNRETECGRAKNRRNRLLVSKWNDLKLKELLRVLPILLLPHQWSPQIDVRSTSQPTVMVALRHSLPPVPAPLLSSTFKHNHPLGLNNDGDKEWEPEDEEEEKEE